MRTLKLRILTPFCTLGLGACQTFKISGPAPNQHPQSKGAALSPKKAPATQAKTPIATLSLWTKVSDPRFRPPLLESQKLINTLSAQSGPLDEALIVQLLLRTHLDEELPGSQLEQKLALKKINLVQSLKSNRLLQSYATFTLLKQILDKGGLSKTFDTPLRLTLGEHIALWQGLKDQDQQKPELDSHFTEEALEWEPEPETSVEAPIIQADPSPSLSPSLSPEPSPSDQRLSQVQKLYERGDYKKALTLIQTAKEDDTHYQELQDKKLKISNKAVQTLRMRAANAYQSAQPVADPNARAAYLKEAASYLKEALEQYPDSTQLSPVRDNLATIAKNLSQLEGPKQ